MYKRQEENICFAAAFFPCKHGKIPLGNHQRKDEGSSYGNYPAKGAIYHFIAACVDCGVVFGHCLRLRHTASEKGAGHPRLVPCVCLLSVSDFPSDEGTYHSRMRAVSYTHLDVYKRQAERRYTITLALIPSPVRNL